MLSKMKKKVTLVTQNVDDLHFKPESDEYEYHAVHGNARYLRCNRNHLTPYKTELRGTVCQHEECLKEMETSIETK